MYSPYVYARRSELLALRSVKDEGVHLGKLLPIVEPVLLATADLKRFADIYGEAGRPAVLVLNPRFHQYKGGVGLSAHLVKELHQIFADHESLIPGLTVHAKITKTHISEFRRAYPDRSVAILLDSPSIDDATLTTLTRDRLTSFVFSLNASVSKAQLSTIPKSKHISVEDGFRKLLRNADYEGVEFFSDRHQKVGDELAGIGDYTITGKTLEIGGGKPGAVAIHASFRHPRRDEVWMEHFVSEDVDRDVGDAPSKFLQAAEKLVMAVNKRPEEFGGNAALEAYRLHVAESTFPGLGKNKQYQIHHHILRMLTLV